MSFAPIHIVIPIAPVAKGRPRFGRGRTYTPKKTTDFEASLRIFVKSLGFSILPEIPTSVSLTCFIKSPKRIKNNCKAPITRPDGDNFLKGVMDALNGVLWKDDSQVTSALVLKRYTSGSPRIILTVAYDNAEVETNGV